MGNYGTDGMGEFPDFGGEKGMKDVFDSLFPSKPRRERDPNRKVGKDDLYARYNPPPPSMDGMG